MSQQFLKPRSNFHQISAVAKAPAYLTISYLAKLCDGGVKVDFDNVQCEDAIFRDALEVLGNVHYARYRIQKA